MQLEGRFGPQPPCAPPPVSEVQPGLGRMNMNIGNQIVSSVVLREKSLKPYLDAGLDRGWLDLLRSRDLIDDLDRQAYEFLLDYWDRHQKTPSLGVFQRNFPAVSYRLVDHTKRPAGQPPDESWTPEENLTPAELIELASVQVLECIFADEYEKAGKAYKDGKIDEAIKIQRDSVAKIN